MRNGLCVTSPGSLSRMPLLLFAYFAVEVLAFIGVAKLIGVGWAFLALFALMVFGILAANLSLRSTFASAARGRSSVGKLAGDSAILLVGWVLCVLPGFVSTTIGLLMIFPPTRALMRRSLNASVQQSMENFSVRLYESSPMSQRRTSYGTFTQPGNTAGEPSGAAQRESQPDHEVIDADELERWYRLESNERPKPNDDPRNGHRDERGDGHREG